MNHARPHLTTHGRAKGHSAIGGVAYRLGLKLYDKRTDTWHDYRRRVLNEEIIAAFTIAPMGAPDWATDAAKVWEAVEAAELRKDSQVAHDFRIPVPFGLNAEQAEAMARSMGQHIVETWATIVSVGLHRDSPVDALGQPKPFGKQGFHAHIYFPTRALSFHPDGVHDDDDGQDGSDGWCFGEKLHAFSKKKAASMVITELNTQWAALANTHVAEIGGVPDFTHLSYKRLGLDKVGQLRLGLSASAMERRGVVTAKGNTLRAQLAGESASHGSAPEVAPVSTNPTTPIPSAPASLPVPAPAPTPMATPTPTPVLRSVSADAAIAEPARPVPETRTPSPPDARAWLEPADPIVFQPPVSPLPGRTSLAGRFLIELASKPELPQPTPEQRSRLVEWLKRIEKALRTLAALALRLADLRERRQRDDMARATFLVEGDAVRQQRAEARDAVTAWTRDHEWRLRVTATLNLSRQPAQLVRLQERVTSLNTELSQFERGAADAAQRVAMFDARIRTDEAAQALAQDTFTTMIEAVHGMQPLYGMVLLSVAAPEHVAPLTAALPPSPRPSAEPGVSVTLRTPDGVLALKPEPPRLTRPSM
ncbi:hypothetical protein J2X57_001120 [Luteibacter sp. 1214]|uniref:MobA/MobL family protein n=1 Tax=Luteibacter sp. 1214 TaxID=2817735 RepID=UPI0028616BE4|nr:MobA/MobL family protein [Luteibacter sp. 1214]MDR6641913.1 hypothetical protein [Luteibacter sp. 1214]